MDVSSLYWIIICHLLGDYVLQSDYLASNKGKNWYCLTVHSILYCVPFVVSFGLDWRASVIFIVHMIVDSLKARWNKIDLTTDQMIHYLIALIYLL